MRWLDLHRFTIYRTAGNGIASWNVAIVTIALPRFESWTAFQMAREIDPDHGQGGYFYRYFAPGEIGANIDHDFITGPDWRPPLDLSRPPPLARRAARTSACCR